MKKILLITAAGVLSLTAKESKADLSGWHIGAGAGVNGYNITTGYRGQPGNSGLFGQRLGFRLDMNTIEGEQEDNEVDDIEYDIKGKMQSFGALIDFYPFAGTWFDGFRLSAGYYLGEIELEGDATHPAGQTFEIGDTTYSFNGSPGKTYAEFEWDTKGPYAGLGFDIGLIGGLKIYFDAGVVFTDKPDYDIDVDLSNLESGGDPVDSDPEYELLEQEIAKAEDEFKDEIQDDVDKLDMYPVARIGFLYRF